MSKDCVPVPSILNTKQFLLKKTHNRENIMSEKCVIDESLMEICLSGKYLLGGCVVKDLPTTNRTGKKVLVGELSFGITS